MELKFLFYHIIDIGVELARFGPTQPNPAGSLTGHFSNSLSDTKLKTQHNLETGFNFFISNFEQVNSISLEILPFFVNSEITMH